jgi:hypothetical protein
VIRTPLRLLVLKRGLTSDSLECELTVAELQDLPVYDALSYVWGDRQDLVIIKCCVCCSTGPVQILLPSLPVAAP